MYLINESAISVTTIAICVPPECGKSAGCVLRISIVKLIAARLFSTEFPPFSIIICLSFEKKLLFALREYSRGRGFSTFDTEPEAASKKTPLAFLMFNIGGSSEEDLRLPPGVGIADVHRHSCDSRPGSRPADDRKHHAAYPHDGGKGIDAGGERCGLFKIQSAYHRADIFSLSDRRYFGNKNGHVYSRRAGYVGCPFGFRARHHCNPSEVRHQGPDASASSRSGLSRVTSTYRARHGVSARARFSIQHIGREIGLTP